MSFSEPLLLLGLALIPLALFAYVAAQRRRRRFAVRYTNVDVLASVAARAGWARHIPAALALAALAALVVALARPERTVAAEQNAATVVMVTDTSGSMLARDVRPDRLTAAKAAARALADELPRDFRLGLVTFGSSVSQLVEPTTDKVRVIAAIDGLQVHGATAMGDGLALGLEDARALLRGRRRAAVEGDLLGPRDAAGDADGEAGGHRRVRRRRAGAADGRHGGGPDARGAAAMTGPFDTPERTTARRR